MPKDPGKSPTKLSRKGQTPSNRTGSRTPNGESKSWFGKSAKQTRSNVREDQTKTISASTPALNNNNNNESRKNNKRPLTVAVDANVTVRRGQQTSKLEAQTPEDLSRSSSITNLNVDQKVKGAKPKKAESKDKLDKVADKKHDKGRALNKNNNKESGDNAPDSLIDVEALQKQLAQMATDKSNLALKLGEQTGQLNKLQNEIAHLKMLQEESAQKLEQLLEENTILRNRLRDVAHSPLSDSEKQQLLYESHRHHNSAPASIATNLLEDSGDITTCPTPEWDKHSSSNVSEVSVACLQDKINQMQETHYSTNEELQATLQELTDLQKQLTELQQENLRVNDEKNLMFESLCRQTERLNDSRSEVESLKQLLYKDENGQFETAAEREQKLVDLIKSAQEEREALLMKQEQLGNELEDSRSSHLVHVEEIAQLTERVKTLESTLDAKHAEHKLLDQELAQAKDQSSSKQIEINRLKDLLENARTKINELEQDRTLSDKSELDELLDNARKEKDALESEVAHLKEKLALSKNENEKLKEQVSILQEECKVTRNNAKTTQSDLEYKLEKVLAEKNALAEQLQQFQEAINELQVQTQCQLDDKRQLSAVLSETQRNLNESERRIVDLENELSELKKTKQEQEEEWEKFQNDLLTSVRVANDFKTEAQQDLQKLIMENKAGRERIKQLEAQVEKMKGGSRRKIPPRLSNEETLIASLNRRYKEIDGLPDSQLTEEQKAVKTLKVHYEKNSPRQKPVAHKPKDKLAISKPSLESVISNPKLEKIVKNSQLRNVESVTYFSDDDERNRKSMSPTRLTLIDSIGAPIDEVAINRTDSFPKVQSDSGLQIVEKAKEHGRSRSLSDLPNIDVETEPKLRRYESTENLLALSKEKKARKKSTVNMRTLEKICNQIDPNTPESDLTNEQRLALRLREVLAKEGKKATLKKNPKLFRKKVVISRPTKESVEQNAKLYNIINNPVYKPVSSEASKITKRLKAKQIKKSKDRYSAPVTPHAIDNSLRGPKKSKSYNDITFNFQVPNMYSEQDEIKTVEFDAVLPPEEFRDSRPSMVENNSAFETFQINNNTFKREHNYLEDEDRDDKKVEEIERVTDEQGHVETVDGKIGQHEELVVDINLSNNSGDEFSRDDTDSRDRNYSVVSKGDGDYDGKEEFKSADGSEEVASDSKIVENVSDYEDKNSYIVTEGGSSTDDDKEEEFKGSTDESDGMESYSSRTPGTDRVVEGGIDNDSRNYYMARQQGSGSDYEWEEECINNADDLEDAERRPEKNDPFDDYRTSEYSKQDTTETINDVIIRRLEHDDDLLNDLDEEERQERRGARQRYSQVIEQMKEKFDKSSDEEEGETKEASVDETVLTNRYITPETDSVNIYQENEPEGEELIDGLGKDKLPEYLADLNQKTSPKVDQDETDIHKILSDTNLKEIVDGADTISADTSNKVSDWRWYQSHFRSTVDKQLTESHTTYASSSSFITFGYGDNRVRDKKEEDANRKISEPVVVEYPTKLGISFPNSDRSDGSEMNEKSLTTTHSATVSDLADSNGDKINAEEHNIPNDAEDDDLTQDEIDLIDRLKYEEDIRNVSEIKPEDVELVLAMKAKYLEEKSEESSKDEKSDVEYPRNEPEKMVMTRPLPVIEVQDSTLFEPEEQSGSESKPVENSSSETRVFPAILPPTTLHKPSTYEPVYENFYIASNKSSNAQTVIPGKKPVALPRISSMDQDVYQDFGGQVRKTRFTISYERMKRESFKEHSQDKASFNEIRNMFERKSRSDFSRIVSKALEDDSN